MMMGRRKLSLATIAFTAMTGPALASGFFDAVNQAIQNQANVQATIAKSAAKAADDAAKALTAVQQTYLQAIFKALTVADDDMLYAIRYSPEPCVVPLLNCRGLPYATVKPVIEAASEARKARATAEDGKRTFYISAGGFGVSIASLLLSIAAYRRDGTKKRK